MTLLLSMDTQTTPQFSLKLISTFEWDKSMGIALQSARERQNISLRNLAKKIGQQTGVKIAHNSLSNLEQGIPDSIKKTTLLAITETLGIAVTDLQTTE